MAKKKVEIVIESKDKTRTGLRSATRGLQGLANVGKIVTSALGIAGVAGAGYMALRAVKSLASTVGEMVREAMPLQGIKAAFEGITEAAGVSADVMLRALQESSAGMITAKDAMESYNLASMLVGDQFAVALPEAMQYLTKVSAATGESMDFMMNSLVRGVGRLSPLILDNLGIQVDLVAAYESYARTLGVTNDNLGAFIKNMSKSEQQAALTTQVMAALRENTAAMPEIIGTAAQQYANLGVQIQDVRDRIGLGLLPAFASMLEVLQPLIAETLPLVESWIAEHVVPALEEWAEYMKVHVPLAIGVLTGAIRQDMFPAFAETIRNIQTIVSALTKVAATFRFVGEVVWITADEIGKDIRELSAAFGYLADVALLTMHAVANAFTVEGRIAVEELKKLLEEPVELTEVQLMSRLYEASKRWVEAMSVGVEEATPQLTGEMYELGENARAAFMAGIGARGPGGAWDIDPSAVMPWERMQAELNEAAAGAGDKVAEALAEGVVEGMKTNLPKIRSAVEKVIQTIEQRLMAIGSAFASMGSFVAQALQRRTIDPLERQLSDLDEEIEALTAARPALGLYQTPAEVEWQRKLTELQEKRAAAAAELEEHQRRMLEMEEQRYKLGFLQQQFDLLGTIKEYGLDAKKILGGLTLGLDANLADFVDAMGRALADVTLVAQETLAANLPAGLTPVPTPAIVAQGAGGAEYHLHIHSQAPTEDVIDDFRIMQTLWS